MVLNAYRNTNLSSAKIIIPTTTYPKITMKEAIMTMETYRRDIDRIAKQAKKIVDEYEVLNKRRNEMRAHSKKALDEISEMISHLEQIQESIMHAPYVGD